MASSGLKPEIILTNGNHLEWNRQWIVIFGSYGTAGKEIAQNRYIRNEIQRPIVGALVREQQIIDDEIVWVNRQMTNEERKSLPARQSEYDTAQEKYEKSRGQLIVNILNSIDSSLITDVQNQSSFDDIITENDQIRLWNLIKTVISIKGGSQVELLQRWRNLKQSTESISKHIKSFEQLYANIDAGAAGITPRAKAEQLVRSVNFVRYNMILANHYLEMEQPVPDGALDPFPSYNILKDKLLRYDEILMKNLPVQSESQSADDAIFFTKEKKFNPTCYNCGEKGHIAKYCTSNRDIKHVKPNVDHNLRKEFKFRKPELIMNHKPTSKTSTSSSQSKTFKKKSPNLKSKLIINKKPNKVFRMVQVEDEDEEDTESDVDDVDANDSDDQEQ
jgi:hypothetical protein